MGPGPCRHGLQVCGIQGQARTREANHRQPGSASLPRMPVARRNGQERSVSILRTRLWHLKIFNRVLITRLNFTRSSRRRQAGRPPQEPPSSTIHLRNFLTSGTRSALTLRIDRAAAEPRPGAMIPTPVLGGGSPRPGAVARRAGTPDAPFLQDETKVDRLLHDGFASAPRNRGARAVRFAKPRTVPRKTVKSARPDLRKISRAL